MTDKLSFQKLSEFIYRSRMFTFIEVMLLEGKYYDCIVKNFFFCVIKRIHRKKCLTFYKVEM